jgi:hypothetical protein
VSSRKTDLGLAAVEQVRPGLSRINELHSTTHESHRYLRKQTIPHLSALQVRQPILENFAVAQHWRTLN